MYVSSYATYVQADNTSKHIKQTNKNSDIKFDSTYVAKKDLPLEYQEQLFNLPVGEVFGPYTENGYQKLSRKIATKSGAAAKASHILIAYEGAERDHPPGPVRCRCPMH